MIHHHATYKKKISARVFCRFAGNVFFLSTFLFILDKGELSQFHKKNTNEADGPI